MIDNRCDRKNNIMVAQQSNSRRPRIQFEQKETKGNTLKQNPRDTMQRPPDLA